MTRDELRSICIQFGFVVHPDEGLGKFLWLAYRTLPLVIQVVNELANGRPAPDQTAAYAQIKSVVETCFGPDNTTPDEMAGQLNAILEFFEWLAREGHSEFGGFERKRELVEDLVSALKDYRISPSPEVAYPMVIIAALLHAELDAFRHSAILVDDLVIAADRVSEVGYGEERLSITLYAEFQVDAFGQKLIELTDLYREYCKLYDVSERMYPLRPLKVAAGSLLLTVAGSAVAIAGLKLGLTALVKYYHRNYTFEGRVDAILKLLAQSDVIIKLCDQLRKRGEDVSPTVHQLNLTAHNATKIIDAFISRVTVIVIDGKPYLLGSKPNKPSLTNRDDLPEAPQASPKESPR